jgi:hypothetical protein
VLVAAGNCFPQRREREAHRFRRNSFGVEADLITEAPDGSRDHDGKDAWVDPEMDSMLVAVPNDHVSGYCSDDTDVLPEASSVLRVIHGREAHFCKGAFDRARKRLGKPGVHGQKDLAFFCGLDSRGKVAELPLALLVEDSEEQISLVSEVGIKGPSRVASLGNNFFDGRPVVPATSEHIARGINQSGSSLRLGLRPSETAPC